MQAINNRHSKSKVALLVACALLAGVGHISLIHAQTAEPRRGEPVTLSFANADIESVAHTMSSITGRNVLVDPRVKGNITLSTDKPVSALAAYNQFLAALRLQGYAVVQADGVDKIVPEADAKLQGGSVAISDGNQAPGGAANQMQTQIFNLHYENANSLVTVLRPLINPNNPINVSPATNTLIVTDYVDNLRRIARIVTALDVPNATDIEVVQLKSASASDLAPLVSKLLETGSSAPAAAGTQADSSFRTTVIAEPRSNSLILRAANQARLQQAKSLIAKLDKNNEGNGNGAAGNIYVVYLKNANAVQLATTLRAAVSPDARSAPSAGSTSPSSSAAGSPGASGASSGSAAQGGPSAATAGLGNVGNTSNQPSTGGQIQADPSTNSLIITASEPQYRQLRAVIDKLDARRAQVFVESLIAEVEADKAAQFGIQWQGTLGQTANGLIGVMGTNFGSGGANIINLATQGASGTVAPSAGLNIGGVQQTGGVYVLGFLANFLESSGDGNVLSTPNLLTLDNEEATIVVGQTVPFVTGQFTNTGASGNTVNPFQTIERKDVGLTLKVRPQISENGTIKMNIYQEVSSLQASTISSPYGPTTNKRTIQSSVLVQDGSIVVLGGLLQDQYAGNASKVPGLGDIPFFGNLFKSDARSRNKTNLMVFLRPVVLRDANSLDKFSVDRYEEMRGLQGDAQPAPSQVLQVNTAPTLPELKPKADK